MGRGLVNGFVNMHNRLQSSMLQCLSPLISGCLAPLGASGVEPYSRQKTELRGRWGRFGASVLHKRCERKASVASAKLVLRRRRILGVYRSSSCSLATPGSRALEGAAASFAGPSGAGLGLGQDGAGRARLMGSRERSGIGRSKARRGERPGRKGRA